MKGGLPRRKCYGNIKSAGFAFPGDVSLTLNMTNACLLWLVFCDLPREFHFVCDDVWITENKKYFQNARFLL